MNVWTIDSEFKDIKYNSIKTSNIFELYMNKLLRILLLRDLDFFETFLTSEMYKEFIEKINVYSNINGSDIKFCSLYFSDYNFSEDLCKIILDLRNEYGLYLLMLTAFPFETFSDELKEISKDLKNINNEFEIRKMLQEISFDLGCSSYALGKIYDYIIKISNNKELLDNNKFLNINNIIKKEIIFLINIYKNCNNLLTIEDLQIIATINNHKSKYKPLDFVISNKILLFLIKDM
jgi:hypothetical protein